MTINQRQQRVVDAIRNDPHVGRGTCSVIDECYTDAELVAKFGQLTPTQAVRDARRLNRNWQDYGDDIRSA